jgi:hypothetical protein
MKNMCKNLLLGLITLGVINTTVMADRGTIIRGFGYGDSASKAIKDAKSSAKMECRSKGGVYEFDVERPIKLDNGSWEVEYNGFCDE